MQWLSIAIEVSRLLPSPVSIPCNCNQFSGINQKRRRCFLKEDTDWLLETKDREAVREEEACRNALLLWLWGASRFTGQNLCFLCWCNNNHVQAETEAEAAAEATGEKLLQFDGNVSKRCKATWCSIWCHHTAGALSLSHSLSLSLSLPQWLSLSLWDVLGAVVSILCDTKLCFIVVSPNLECDFCE